MDRTTATSALYSSVPFGNVPANGWWALNNNFGTASLVNGTDFVCAINARASIFPVGTVLEWSFPLSGGTPGFAYAYPEIIYGQTEQGGNPYNVVGPWSGQGCKINQVNNMVITYDLTLTGNALAYDTLIDTYVTNNAAGTTVVAEISFFPQSNLIASGLTNTSVHTFSWGECLVGIQGKQICVFPTSGSGTVNRSILALALNMKELFTYLVGISLGGLTGNEFIQGVQFGVECQIPAVYNSGNCFGTGRFNKISVLWN